MTEVRRVVKIFLASPGDLSEERRTAKAVADEFNALLADEFGYQVELVGWEDTISEAGRPQAIINRDLERCEVFVGMIWKRWGTPPGGQGRYTSGFEEEFRTSLARQKQTGRPAVSLLFKEIGEEFLGDPGKDLKKVLDFKDELVSKKEILFEQFRDTRDFEGKFRRCITAHVRRLKSQENEQRAGTSQSTATEELQPPAVVREGGEDETPISRKGAAFLHELISKTQLTATKIEVPSVDIARFRLLSTVLWQQGNDEQSVGVHDANLLYASAADLDLGYPEMEALLKSGLAHFSNENTPVWKWFASIEDQYPDLLPFLSLTAFTSQRVGALEAMRLLGGSMEFDPIIGRPTAVEIWLSAPNEIKAAALEYLGDWGRPEDLVFIRKEFDNNDHQTSAKAAAAIVSISLRESRSKAIQALYDLRPPAIDDSLVKQIFSRPESIDTETLVKGLEQPNVEVRRRAIALLRLRGELSIELAEKLLNDADASVRYEALKSLEEGGRSYNEESMKAILVKPVSSGFGFLYTGSDRSGEEKLEQARWESLRKLSDGELTALIRDDEVFDRRAEFVLAERHFEVKAVELRKQISDGYQREFNRALSKLEGVLQRETIERIRSVGEQTRRELTRNALNVICRNGGNADLPTVRGGLSDPNLEYSSCDMEFLGRFGEWEDIALIVKRAASAGRLGTSLLGGGSEEKYRESAQAILALSKNRLKDVLAIEMPTGLLTRVIVGSSGREFRGLANASVLELFRSESDSVRKVTALRAVRTFGKKRVTDLLTAYTGHRDRKYFYNVVHWLDLGVSLDRERAVGAASKALNEMEASGHMGGAGTYRRRRRR